MPEHEARVRAFYDHEAEEPRAGRRRRQVADWGVGEDVFDRLPSRRFSRAESAHPRRAAEVAAAEPDTCGAAGASAPEPDARRAPDPTAAEYDAGWAGAPSPPARPS